MQAIEENKNMKILGLKMLRGRTKITQIPNIIVTDESEVVRAFTDLF